MPNQLLDYSKLRMKRDTTVIAPANPRDIRYSDGKYYVNFVICVNNKVRPNTVAFDTYPKAYAYMNQARVWQGFKPLSDLKEYKG